MSSPFKKSTSGSVTHQNWESNGGPKMSQQTHPERTGGSKMADSNNFGSTHTDSTYKGKGSASPRNGSPQESYYQTNAGNGNKGAM